MASLVGTVLQDSYRLTRIIGQGGMGTVYEALQLRLGKRFAIKVMARELSASEDAMARFRREAEITSQLGHPHIVNVFDFGIAPSGEPYLVMEFLDGEDLEHRLHRVGSFPLGLTVHIIKQVASALATTHAHGIIHRDLKPANISLLEIAGERDFVKVLDFGISKARASATKLTGESTVMGTPCYMAPEQATGQIEVIDHRTDEWALACITYEMLSGRPPFRGDDNYAILYQVIHEHPAGIARRLGLPPDLDGILNRALAKQKEDRFPTVTAFVRALEALANTQPVPRGDYEFSLRAHAAPLPEVPPEPQRARHPALRILDSIREIGTSFGRKKRGAWRLAAIVLVPILLFALIRSFVLRKSETIANGPANRSQKALTYQEAETERLPPSLVNPPIPSSHVAIVPLTAQAPDTADVAPAVSQPPTHAKTTPTSLPAVNTGVGTVEKQIAPSAAPPEIAPNARGTKPANPAGRSPSPTSTPNPRPVGASPAHHLIQDL